MKQLSILLKGLIKENPVFVLVLGTCPTLAMTDSVTRAIGMGLSAAAVLICSNIVISLLRNVIPDKVRIPSYIVVIAGFVTAIQMVLHAYMPDLYDSLGTYLALIVVNCIILGRAEMFASKNGVLDSALDGVGMGLGFTLALFLMATIREVFGAGSFCGYEIPVLSKLHHTDTHSGARRIHGLRTSDSYRERRHQGQGAQEKGLRLQGLPRLFKLQPQLRRCKGG